MINSISFKHYKAFDYGKIGLKPITILLGANSVGKSSIIQLFLMLQQTAIISKNNKSALVLNDDKIKLGDSTNLFRNKNTSKPLSITFELEDNYSYWFRKNIIDDFFKPLELFYHCSPNISEQVSQLRKLSWRKNREDFILLLDAIINTTEELFSYWKREHSLITREKQAYISAFDFIQLVNFTDTNAKFYLTVNFQKHGKQNRIYVSKLTLYKNENIVIELSADKFYRPHFSLISDFYNNGKNFCSDEYQKQIQSVIPDLSINLFNFFSKMPSDSFFSEEKKELSALIKLFLSSFEGALKSLKGSFSIENINYVSPLRAFPQRYYFLDRTHVSSSLDTLDGESVIEIIKENREIKQKVNIWLKHFGLEIDVEAIEEFIHKLKVNQNNLKLDITDVGFGISQILPVIVQGFFAKKDSLTVIEQPEVHLHPKMQADLADLLIDIALPKETNGSRLVNKYLLVETHSEYLLKRLRRRIATKEISPSDVGIYIIRSQDDTKQSIIEDMTIASNGSFQWPEEFYGGELLQDTIEYLKAQAEN